MKKATVEEIKKLEEFESDHNVKVLRCCDNCKCQNDNDPFVAKVEGYSCNCQIHDNSTMGDCPDFIFDDENDCVDSIF